MIPSALIFLPLIAALVAAMLKYSRRDPVRRILNLYFLLAACDLVAMLAYLWLSISHRGVAWISQIFILVAFALLGVSIAVFRRKPRPA